MSGLIGEIVELYHNIEGSTPGQIVIWSWIIGAACLIVAIAIHAVPEKHQLWLVPIINMPGALAMIVIGFALRLAAPIGLILMLIFTFGGENSIPMNFLGGLLLIFLLTGGFGLIFFSTSIIAGRAETLAKAQGAADQARLAQKILDEDL